MKLYEIKANIPKSKKAVGNILKNKNLAQAGTGVQAVAYLHKKFPNTIVKAIYIEGEHDAAYQFVRLCMNHQNNPFFPKIFYAKMYDTRYDGIEQSKLYKSNDLPDYRPQLLIVVMEKLHKIDEDMGYETSLQLLQSLGILPEDLSKHPKQWTTQQWRERFDKNAAGYEDEEEWWTNLDEPSPLEYRIKGMFEIPKNRMWLRNNTNNPKLAEAMRLLEPLFRRFTPDIHMDNIMIRRTGVGPQLVFVDPVVLGMYDTTQHGF